MPLSEHQALHRDLNAFLRQQEDEFGNHMRPQPGNSRAVIRGNFSRTERLDALAQSTPGRGPSTAVRRLVFSDSIRPGAASIGFVMSGPDNDSYVLQAPVRRPFADLVGWSPTAHGSIQASNCGTGALMFPTPTTVI